MLINGKKAKLNIMLDGKWTELVPLKHAKWKLLDGGRGICSSCNFTQIGVWDFDSHQRYCGVCGAEMSLEE